VYILAYALAMEYDQRKKGMSGGDRILIEISKELMRRGHSSLIVTSETGAVMLREYGIHQFLSIRGTSGPFRILKKIIRGSVTSLRFDLSNVEIVYSSSIFLEDIIPGLMAKIRAHDAKWVVGYWLFPPNPFSKENPYRGKMWLRGLAFYLAGKLSQFLVRRWSDGVLVTNNLDKEKFERMGISPTRILVLKGGVDGKACLPSTESIYDAVFIGRLHPQKGVIQLIDVWEKVSKRLPDSKLLIIGNGPLEDEVKARIRMKGLNRNVEMVGFKDGVEKMLLFSRSKIVLHPVLYDSGGMAPCEAMICGLPCIAYDIPELREYYPKGCLKVKPYDIEEFAEKIINLLTDEGLFASISTEAKKYCADWDWEKKARELEGFLLSLKG